MYTDPVDSGGYRHAGRAYSERGLGARKCIEGCHQLRRMPILGMDPFAASWHSWALVGDPIPGNPAPLGPVKVPYLTVGGVYRRGDGAGPPEPTAPVWEGATRDREPPATAGL
jgi:hypothetical protein